MKNENSSVFVLVLFNAAAPGGPPYSLEEAAQQVAIHPDLLRYYCATGLLGEKHLNPAPGMTFDDNALHALRRIEYFRRQHGVGRHTLRIVAELLHENERLQSELHVLRNR